MRESEQGFAGMGQPLLALLGRSPALHGLATTLAFAGVLAFTGVGGGLASAVALAGILSFAAVLVGIGGIQLHAGVAGLAVTACQKPRERGGGENAGGSGGCAKGAIHQYLLCKCSRIRFWIRYSAAIGLRNFHRIRNIGRISLRDRA